MSVPLDLSEQKRNNWFKPSEKLGLYIGNSKYEELGFEHFKDLPHVV